MEHQSIKGNSISTNSTIGTNGRVERTATHPEALEDIQVFIMRCTSWIEHQSNKENSIGTNRTTGTNARVECVPTQPGAIGNKSS